MLFRSFAARTDGTTYEPYALAGAAYLEAQITASGSVPEKAGSTTGFDTGLYAGAAGDAFVFLALYRHTGDTRWRNDANRLLAWLRALGIAQPTGTAWPGVLRPPIRPSL